MAGFCGRRRLALTSLTGIDRCFTSQTLQGIILFAVILAAIPSCPLWHRLRMDCYFPLVSSLQERVLFHGQ
ncbi:unnamed protein product [Musa acuminata subsp. malaccensis]|uniref:(wild Malaysian banana) hypothetical protein n=1 Tax=Musa acuminata subsp. malaccensis TaxID=214687 RepID=A0A804KLV5_MUSAM|nr:unnamed protein product [Musa acuminata subsp. malaccensis]